MQTVTFGGKEYKISPVLLRDLYELQDDINRMKLGSDNPATESESILIMAKVVAAGIKRHHEGFTVDTLLDSMDASEMDAFIKAYSNALASSGLVQSGEATPAETTS